MARGQMFGQLLGNLTNVGKAALPIAKQAAVPLAVTGGVLGLGALGKAGVDAVRGEKVAQGETITSGSPGMGNDAAAVDLISKVAGITTQQARDMLPLINQLQDENLRRGMEATAQVGQIQGDLARQKYGFQLAGGAQQVGLGTLQALMSNPNPYAQTGLSGVSNLSL